MWLMAGWSVVSADVFCCFDCVPADAKAVSWNTAVLMYRRMSLLSFANPVRVDRIGVSKLSSL